MALSRAPQTVLPGAVPGMEPGKGKSLVKPLPAPPPQQPGIGMAPPGGPSQVGMRPQPMPGVGSPGAMPGMRPPPMGLPGVGLDMGGGMSSRIGLGQQMGPAMSGFRQQPMEQDMRKQALMQLLGGGG